VVHIISDVIRNSKYDIVIAKYSKDPEMNSEGYGQVVLPSAMRLEISAVFSWKPAPAENTAAALPFAISNAISNFE